jgi:hypothetical protein
LHVSTNPGDDLQPVRLAAGVAQLLADAGALGPGIGRRDSMGGWVRVYADRTASLPEDFALYLSGALTQWFRERPQLRMRQVVPIQRDGDTVELHAWFDQTIFPDRSGQHPQQVK